VYESDVVLVLKFANEPAASNSANFRTTTPADRSVTRPGSAPVLKSEKDLSDVTPPASISKEEQRKRHV
jgi:hypothetical protein